MNDLDSVSTSNILPGFSRPWQQKQRNNQLEFTSLYGTQSTIKRRLAILKTSIIKSKISIIDMKEIIMCDLDITPPPPVHSPSVRHQCWEGQSRRPRSPCTSRCLWWHRIVKVAAHSCPRWLPHTVRHRMSEGLINKLQVYHICANTFTLYMTHQLQSNSNFVQ